MDSFTKYSLETSFLSTLLSTHTEADEEFFMNQELEEEFFDTYFHRLVVKAINNTTARGLPIFEEAIANELINNRVMDDNLWFRILSANPFSKYLYEAYLPQLKATTNSTIGAI